MEKEKRVIHSQWKKGRKKKKAVLWSVQKEMKAIHCVAYKPNFLFFFLLMMRGNCSPYAYKICGSLFHFGVFVVVVVVVVVFAFLYPREEVIEQKKKVAKQLHAEDNTKSVKQHNTIIHTYKSRGKKTNSCGVFTLVWRRYRCPRQGRQALAAPRPPGSAPTPLPPFHRAADTCPTRQLGATARPPR